MMEKNQKRKCEVKRSEKGVVIFFESEKVSKKRHV